MTDPFDNLTRTNPHSIHRVKLIPPTVAPDKQTNRQVPTTNKPWQQEGAQASVLLDRLSDEVTTQPLSTPDRRDIERRELRKRLLKAKAAGNGRNTSSEHLAQITFPTLPLLTPGSKTGQQVPAGQPSSAEISGAAGQPPAAEISRAVEQLSTVKIAGVVGQPSSAEISGAAGNAAIVGVGNIAGYFFKYANNLVIQRTLGVELFGLYSVSLSLVTLISSIFDLGLDNAMIRYIAIYRGRKQQTNSIRSLVIFCTSLVGITGLLGALVVMVFAPFLAKLVHKPDTAPVLQILAPLIPLLCMQTVWTGGLQGLKEFKRRVFVQRFFVPLLLLLLMVVALIFFRNVVGVAVLALLSAMISTIINLYFLFRAVSRVSGRGDEKYEVRTWLSFALPNFLTTIVNTMLDSIDTLLLAFFVSNVQIGQYSAAIKISLFISLPLTSLNVVFTPTIAELYAKKEYQKLLAMFQVVTKWTITLTLPIFAISTLFSVPLLELSGKGFTGAWPLVIALAAGNLANAATGPVGYILLMTGHQKFSLFNSAGTIVLNIILGIILTPRYGAMGTAISTGIAISVINVIRLIEVYVLLKMFPYRWDTLKPFIAGFISALLTGILIYLLNLTNFSLPLFHAHLSIQLALVPVFLASYTFLLVLFKINPEDQIVLNRLRTKFGPGKKAKPQRKVV